VSPPLRECDVVMKGGIASGVVYAGAIRSLAREFRFRSVGGTSAGAIAAALAAAAEFRRQTRGADAFADLLEPVVDDLTSRRFFPRLLQSGWTTRPVIRIGLAAVNPAHGRLWRTVAILARLLAGVWWLTLPVVAGAAVLAWQVVAQDIGALLTVILVAVVVVLEALLALGGAAAVLAWLAVRAIAAPGNRLGLCSGLATTGPQSITDWLYTRLQEVAGLGHEEPLTFAKLAEHEIALTMISTDLASALPMRLPMDERAARDWWYDPADMAALYPAGVCGHLEALATGEQAEGLRRLPAAELPVIVALRMSLGVPLLLSAVPLIRRHRDADGRPVPRRHWFVDGGVTSNFPIHFFDAWLPQRPTFAFDLRSGSPPDAERVHLPAPDDPAPSPWTDVRGAVGVLRQAASAAQNWRDTAQAELPGYRDRVCEVRLRSGEGGIHINLPPATAWELVGVGDQAGAQFVEKFDDRRLARHQGTRYVLLMRLLQGGLSDFGAAFKAVGRRLDGNLPGSCAYRAPFPEHARRATESLLAVVPRWRRDPGGVDFDDGIEADPPPAMRVGPRL
jgi:predicted acylesterase/phospholipase RssA